MFTFWDVSCFGTLLMYGILYDCRMLSIWLCFLVGYIALGIWQGHSNANNTRRKIRMSTWDPPTDPLCYIKIEINLAKVAFINKD